MTQKTRRKKFSSAIYVLFITVIITLVDFIFLTWEGKPVPTEKWGELLFHFFVIGGIGAIIAFVWEVLESYEGSTDSVNRLRDSISQMKNTLDLSKRTEEMKHFDQYPIIGKLLPEWNRELAKALDFSSETKRFTVTQEMQALRSYEIFWELLVDEQRTKTVKEPLNVLIIHSSSLDIWSEYAIRKQLLGYHRRFHDNGGRVTRILCAKGEPNETAKKIAKEMENAGVKVFYYDTESKRVAFEFKWDFLYVKELEIAVIWDAFDLGKTIQASTYQVGKTFRDYDLEKLWQDIKQHSVEIT